MNIQELYDYCLSKKGVTEHFPFDEVTLVFKVMGKMFALTNIEQWEKGTATINLKCNPDWAQELRDTYESIKPGFHMNKKHWNTVTLNSNDISDAFALELIAHSYNSVVSGLTKKLRTELENLS